MSLSFWFVSWFVVVIVVIVSWFVVVVVIKAMNRIVVVVVVAVVVFIKVIKAVNILLPRTHSLTPKRDEHNAQ